MRQRPGSLGYDDLLRMPEDGVRREILGGELVVTPSPSGPHQDAAGAIFAALKAYADRVGGWAYLGPRDVCLGLHDVLVPDVLYIAPERLAIIQERALVGAPTIAVEVLSHSTERSDRTRKRTLYARYGVEEYWLVDPDARSVERLTRPERDDYADAVVLREIVESLAAPGLTVSLGRIFAAPPRAKPQ